MLNLLPQEVAAAGELGSPETPMVESRLFRGMLSGVLVSWHPEILTSGNPDHQNFIVFWHLELGKPQYKKKRRSSFFLYCGFPYWHYDIRTSWSPAFLVSCLPSLLPFTIISILTSPSEESKEDFSDLSELGIVDVVGDDKVGGEEEKLTE